MSGAGEAGGAVWVERVHGRDDVDVWVVSASGRDVLQRPEVKTWLESVRRIFDAHSEIASVSMVAAGEARAFFQDDRGITAVQAGAAALPLCMISGRVADLVGLTDADDTTSCAIPVFQRWIETATLKGLIHLWLVAEAPTGLSMPLRAVPALPDEHARFVPADLLITADSTPMAISVGIDAAWLLGGESGAQVFVFEMLKELARRTEIAHIVLISESGGLPRSLDGVPKVAGVSWAAALAQGAPLVDVMHRPCQPGEDVDYRRYHRVARCVALTVLDFIAYDNPAYHESAWSWRRYQEAFDENVCLADCVFAISRCVGSRLERQFAHQLPGPVRSVLLGTDHLEAPSDTAVIQAVDPAVKALESTAFLLVLGNDFEHKNRDFAVRVFADMRDRVYGGLLVLAGFHLDGGSSFSHELSGAGRHADHVVRTGAVSAIDKTWLLRHADAVLYPTSSEGFGLVPFEAAALGTPTAFVAFGPLHETLAGVDASPGWQVRPFADHVFALIADPARQVRQVRAAGTSLTWASHVDQVLDGYRALVGGGAPWRVRARALPGAQARVRRTVDAFRYRVTNKLRRLAGRR